MTHKKPESGLNNPVLAAQKNSPEFWQNLIKQHGTLVRACEKTGISRCTIRGYLRRFKIDYDETHNSQASRTVNSILERYGINKATMPLSSWIGYADQRARVARQFEGAERILVLSDLHCPFTNWRAFEGALAIKADVCVLAGDIFDLQSVSYFIERKDLSLDQEVCHGLKAVERIRKRFPNHCVMIQGNHEHRLQKIVRASLPAEVRALLESEYGTEFDTMAQIITGRVPDLTVLHGHYVRLGDAVVSHFDKYSSIEARSAIGVADYFDNWWDQLDPTLVRPVVAIHAHTHHLTKTIHRRWLCIESGTLAHPMDYVLGRKTGSGEKNAWHPGCVLLVQKNGKTDWTKTNFYWLGQ